MKQDYLDVMNSLTKFHALFSEFWSVGYITESNSIPTAAVSFDEIGQSLQFMINPNFWKGLSLMDKQFIICHECLHLYLDHGSRIIKLKNKYVANIAADLVVNHYLIDKFGFNRSTLSFSNIGGPHNLVWLDNDSFKGLNLVPNKSMEYYYHQLIKESNNMQSDGVSTLDDHTFADQSQSNESTSGLSDLVDRITGNISTAELENFIQNIESNSEESTKIDSSIQAGTIAGHLHKKIVLSKVVKKKTWEKLFNENLCKYKGPEITVPREQWARENRRISILDKDLMLPSEVDVEISDKTRINVWLFQDTSGSCERYAERFFKAAMSIPEDKFMVRGFCFDTRVYEVDYKNGELKGFGGTSFYPIEEKIQQIIAEENVSYPEYVFVVTDGYGSSVYPQYPERWHWLMTDHNTTAYVPPKSQTHLLNSFE